MALNQSITVRLMADASNFNATVKAAGQTAEGVASNMEKSGNASNMLTTGLIAAGAAAAALGVTAINTFRDYDAAMSEAAAATNATSGELDLLREAAIEAGADTIYSATEAAQGITELGKAGLSTTDILNGGLSGALNLAASDGMEVSEAAELMASALAQFNLEGSDATRVADALAAGAASAQGSAHDLGLALNQSGMVANAFGISMEETVGTLSAFANAGMIGSDAGTSLKTMLLQLANPTSKSADLMEELGINAYDAQGNFIGLEGLAGQLESQMSSLSQEQRNQALATIFGSDAIRAANVLYEQGADGIAEWTDTVSQSGYAADMASARTDNLNGDLEGLSGSFETLMISIGSGANGPLREIVQTLDMLVDAFSDLPSEVQQGIVLVTALAGGAAALHKVLGPLSNSTSTFAQNMSLVADPVQRVSTALPLLKSGFSQIGEAALGAVNGVDTLSNGMTRGQSAVNGFGSIADGLVSLMGGPWGIAFTIAGAALLEWVSDAQAAKQAADNVSTALETTGDASEALIDYIENMELGNGNGLPEWLDRLRTGAENVPELLEQCGLSMADLAKAAQGDEEALEKYNQRIVEVGQGMGKGKAQSAELANVLDQATAAYEEGAEGADRHSEAVEELADSEDGAADSTGELADATADTADAAQEAADAVDELIDSLFELEGAHISAYDAETQLHESMASLSDTIKENGATLDVNTEAGRANRSALADLASQAIDTANAYLEEGQATGDMASATENARGTLESARTAFIDAAKAAGMTESDAAALADQFGLTSNKADELTDAINAVPDSKKTKVDVNTDQAKSNVQTLSGMLAGLKDKTITITTQQITRQFVQTYIGETVNTTGPLKDGYKKADGGLVGYRDGGLLGLADGDGYTGLLTGWGGKKSDNILIAASPGEFMQQASAVDYYGVDMMRALNESAIPREWLEGPTVQVWTAPAPQSAEPVVNVSVATGDVVAAIQDAVKTLPGIIARNTPVMGRRTFDREARRANRYDG